MLVTLLIVGFGDHKNDNNKTEIINRQTERLISSQDPIANILINYLEKIKMYNVNKTDFVLNYLSKKNF